jgi:hypothetical protein
MLLIYVFHLNWLNQDLQESLIQPFFSLIKLNKN